MQNLALSLVVAGIAASAGAFFAHHRLPSRAEDRPQAAAFERLHARCVEVRSASVFAGACHFNGELVTQGAEALFALSVDDGSRGGVDLSGLCAAALVASSENLKLDKPRRSIVYVSADASASARERLVELLRERAGLGLGEIVAIEPARIEFASDADAFSVRVGERIALEGAPLANRECCKMPNLVWYEPLLPLSGRVVGFTRKWSVSEPRLDLELVRVEENSAFVGELALFAGACASE